MTRHSGIATVWSQADPSKLEKGVKFGKKKTNPNFLVPVTVCGKQIYFRAIKRALEGTKFIRNTQPKNAVYFSLDIYITIWH